MVLFYQHLIKFIVGKYVHKCFVMQSLQENVIWFDMILGPVIVVWDGWSNLLSFIYMLFFCVEWGIYIYIFRRPWICDFWTWNLPRWYTNPNIICEGGDCLPYFGMGSTTYKMYWWEAQKTHAFHLFWYPPWSYIKLKFILDFNI